jgi:hypothetical protein
VELRKEEEEEEEEEEEQNLRADRTAGFINNTYFHK